MGVMAQKGAGSTQDFSRNLMGKADAGDMGIGFEFENFHQALSAFHEARQDSMLMEVNRKRWEDPAGDISGPVLMREHFYKPMDITVPVVVVRTYQMSRKHLPEMIEIVKEIDSLSNNQVTAMVSCKPHLPKSRIPSVLVQIEDWLRWIGFMASTIFNWLSQSQLRYTDVGKYIDEVGLRPKFQESS